MIAAEWTPWALVAVTAVLIPGAVALFRMRRDVDSTQQRIGALETQQTRFEQETDGLRGNLSDLKTTVAAGFARIEALLSIRDHHK